MHFVGARAPRPRAELCVPRSLAARAIRAGRGRGLRGRESPRPLPRARRVRSRGVFRENRFCNFRGQSAAAFRSYAVRADLIIGHWERAWRSPDNYRDSAHQKIKLTLRVSFLATRCYHPVNFALL